MIVTEPPSRPGAQFPTLDKAALLRFLKRAQRAAGLTGEVTVLLADNARLKQLNRDFRGKNKATDVLSFPAMENAASIAGDLAISVETAARQASEHGHSLDDELRILLLHGVLHLAGHDHETDAGEMREVESALREKLKLPVGLIERTLPALSKKRATVNDVASPAHVSNARRGAPMSSPARTVVRRGPAKKAAASKAKTQPVRAS